MDVVISNWSINLWFSSALDFRTSHQRTKQVPETNSEAKISPSFKMKKASGVVKLDGLSQNGRNGDQYIKM